MERCAREGAAERTAMTTRIGNRNGAIGIRERILLHVIKE
jgi:hypothetical protein